jgi:hypothetical protein
MKFLLNSNIQIFALEREEKEDGAFVEKETLIGSFFCSVRILKKEREEFLTVILREYHEITDRLKVVYQSKEYLVLSVSKITDGFLKLICKR